MGPVGDFLESRSKHVFSWWGPKKSIRPSESMESFVDIASQRPIKHLFLILVSFLNYQ